MNTDTVVKKHKIPDPLMPFRRICGNLSLFRMLFRNDCRAKFRHSILGFLWLFIPPVCILLIYVYMFCVVFNMRWPDRNFTSRWGFGLVIYTGITIYSSFSDSIMGSLNLLTSRAGMLKRVPYPFELLSVSMVCSNMFISGIVLWLLFFLSLATGGSGSLLAVIFFPLIYLPYTFLTIGISWIISALGVFFRDLGNLLSIILLLLFFASPVLYSPDMIPENFLWLLRINPITPVISGIRGLFLQNTVPDWREILCLWVVAFIVFQAGYAFFQRMRRYFADVV